MPTSITTLPAIRHALVNRYRRVTPAIKIPKDMVRIDEEHPDLSKWIRRNKDDSVVWLKDIKTQEKGIKTSRDIDPSKYVMLNEGYFHSPSNAAPFLYVRRDDLSSLTRDYRKEMIEKYKNSSEVEKLSAVIHALIEMGEFDEYSDDIVEQAGSLVPFLGRKKPRAETITEARLKSKLDRIIRTFSVRVSDHHRINIKSLSLKKNGKLRVTFEPSSSHRSWDIWDNFSLTSEVEPTTLEATPDEQNNVLLACVLGSDAYLRIEQIQVLADQHRQDHNLTTGQIRDRLNRISQQVDLSSATMDEISREMGILNVLMSTYEQAEFRKNKDGIIIACYLAPSIEAKNAKVAVAELNFTLPFASPDQCLAFMDETLASLPNELIYPVIDGKQLCGYAKAGGKGKKKHKKKMGNPDVPPLTRTYRWSISNPSEEIPVLIPSIQAWGDMAAAEGAASLHRSCANGTGYRFAPESRSWHISMKIGKINPFAIRVPHPEASSLDEFRNVDEDIRSIAVSVRRFFDSAEFQGVLSLIHAYAAHTHRSNDPIRPGRGAVSETVEKTITLIENRLASMQEIADEMRIRAERRKQFEKMVSTRPYHEFMYRANQPRKVTCYIAPTNAGKSWQARQQIMQDLGEQIVTESVALFPLRMLALENQLWFQDQGVPASLVTGEERDLVAEARLTCQTVETLDSSRTYSTVMVDEAQLTFEMDRGPAYLRALVSADCDHLVLTASPEAKKKITSLFERLGESVEFVEMQRLCPLAPIHKVLRPRDIQSGDLVVAFSTKVVHQIASSLRGRGFSVGTLYGAMPPTTRRHMMDNYLAGNIDVMVSTDAIGMGCNCPVDRVLFAQTDKFDGKQFRELTASELKQVAGRAGRYGFAESGSFGVVEMGRFPLMHPSTFSQRVMTDIDPCNMGALHALPDREVFLGSDFTLRETITSWKRAVSGSKKGVSYKFHAESINEMLSKADDLDPLIKSGKLDRETATKLLFVALNYEKQGEFYRKWLDLVAQGKRIKYLDNVHIEGMGRMTLEDVAKDVTILAQFQRVVPSLCPSEHDIMSMQRKLGETIYEKLEKAYSKPAEPAKVAND